MSDRIPLAALAVIGDRRALAWVLTEGRIAFPVPRNPSQFPDFKTGDLIYLYTTRGCFKNPTRDRSRVIGRATATSDLRTTDEPYTLGDREFPYELDIQVASLAPFGQGINVAAEVEYMTSFPKPERWSIYLRRSAWSLTTKDAKRFDKMLKPYEGRLNDNIAEYQLRARIGLVAATEAPRT